MRSDTASFSPLGQVTFDDIMGFMSSTLHGVQAGKVDVVSLRAVLEWLVSEGFITGDAGNGQYTPLPLGKAAQQSALPPEVAKIIWSDIVRAREQVKLNQVHGSGQSTDLLRHVEREGKVKLTPFICRESFWRTTCTSSSSSLPLTERASPAGRALRSCSRHLVPTGLVSLKG